tara:strand:+ start:492 stop:941 length:450 start_codon:yes stop_codon:yes gene_type:complete
MIKRIDNFNLDNANKIWHIFQNSYAVEANILKVDDFPVLKRCVTQIIQSNNNFFAFYDYSDLVALIEIDIKAKIHIQSLVVYPDHFRKGYAKKLVKHVLIMFDSYVFTAETGFDNLPAKNLYLSLGFAEMLQYDADYGIKKIKYERKNN